MKFGRIIEFDVSRVSTAAELHDRIAAAFCFPYAYGRDWEAFVDCVMAMSPPPASIRVTGIRELTDVLTLEAALFEHCLCDLGSALEEEGVDIQWT